MAKTSLRKPIEITNPEPGVLLIQICYKMYGLTGDHWREQLTKSNGAKWGTIYVDPDRAECEFRRWLAMSDFGSGTTPGTDRDECPGAMFIWEDQGEIAHVQECESWSNRALGRDLYSAIADATRRLLPEPLTVPIRRRMGWWIVRFSFVLSGSESV